MMKPLIEVVGLSALVAVVSFFASGSYLAADETPAAKAVSEEAAQKGEPIKQASGKVAAVDLEKKIVSVKKGPLALQENYLIDRQTSITRDNEGLSLRELKPGVMVKIEYVIKEGQNVARSITTATGQ